MYMYCIVYREHYTSRLVRERVGWEGRVQIKVKGVAQAMLGMDGDISSGKYAGEKGRGGMF